MVCTFKKVLIKTDLFYEILQQLMQAHLQFPANSLESFDERGIYIDSSKAFPILQVFADINDIWMRLPTCV